MARLIKCDNCGTEEPCVWDDEDSEACYWRRPDTWLNIEVGKVWRQEDFCSLKCMIEYVQSEID